MRGIREYLFKPIPVTPRRRDLQAMKHLEWIFIVMRFLLAPVGFLIFAFHTPASSSLMIALILSMIFFSAIVSVLNHHIKDAGAQWRLGIAALIVDALAFWCAFFLFAYDFHTPAYAFFVIVIVEAAVRFGLVGSMLMAVVFHIGYSAAMIFRGWAYDIVGFHLPGYVFWTSFMTLLAIIMGLMIRETQREQQMNEQLAEESTLLAERHRIARDLHDTVLKTLQGLSLEAYALQKHPLPQNVQSKLRYIEEVCRHSSQEIREVVFELRQDRQKVGICSQLSQAVAEWSGKTGINASCTINGDDRNMSLMACHNLQYVLSEALTNIQKHAAASNVQIDIDMLQEKMRISIHDDGCGIPKTATGLYAITSPGHFGILGMKERTEQLEGQFSIENKNGTKLIVEIPLSVPNER